MVGGRGRAWAAALPLVAVGLGACGAGGEVRAAGVGRTGPSGEGIATRALVLEGDDLADLRAGPERGGVVEVAVGTVGRPVWSMAGLWSPRAVPLADGTLYYASVEDELRPEGSGSGAEEEVVPGTELGVPVVRASTSTGDEVVARGALTFAVRDDHSLAYVRGSEAAMRASTPYLGDVVVRDPQGRERVVSPRSAQWRIKAWAGDHLVVYDDRGEGGGGAFHLLDTADGALTELPPGVPVAVSGSGGQVLVASGPVLPDAPDDAEVLHLVDVPTGDVTAAVTAAEARRLGVEVLSDRWGDWSGTTAVVPAEPAPLVLTIDDKGILPTGTIELGAPGNAWVSQVVLSEVSPSQGVGVVALVERNDFDDPEGALIAEVRACDEEGCTVLREARGERQDLSLAHNPSAAGGR